MSNRRCSLHDCLPPTEASSDPLVLLMLRDTRTVWISLQKATRLRVHLVLDWDPFEGSWPTGINDHEEVWSFLCFYFPLEHRSLRKNLVLSWSKISLPRTSWSKAGWRTCCRHSRRNSSGFTLQFWKRCRFVSFLEIVHPSVDLLEAWDLQQLEQYHRPFLDQIVTDRFFLLFASSFGS